MTPHTTAGLVTPTPRPAGHNPTTLAVLTYGLRDYAGASEGDELTLTAAHLHALVRDALEAA